MPNTTACRGFIRKAWIFAHISFDGMDTEQAFEIFYRTRYASAVYAVIVCLFVHLSSVHHKLELYKDG